MSVTGSTDERVTTMPTTRSVSLGVLAALGLAPGGRLGRATIGSVLPTCRCSSAAPFWSMAISPARSARGSRPASTLGTSTRCQSCPSAGTSATDPPGRARRAGCSGRRRGPRRPHPAAWPASGSSRPARSRSARRARRRPSTPGGSVDRRCSSAMPPRPRPGRPPHRRPPAGRAAPIRATVPGSRAPPRAGPPACDQAVRVWWSGTWHMAPRIGSVSRRGEGARPQPAGGAATTTPFVLAPFPPGGTGWRNKGQRSGQRPTNSWWADTVHPAVPECRGTVGGSRGGRP